MSILKQKFDENFLKDKDFRQIFFDRLIKLQNNWQKHRTPEDVTRKMTAKTDLANKKICVIFNMELVEQLVIDDGVLPENVRFIADNPQEALFAYKVYGVISKYVSESEGVKGIRKAMEEILMKFDLVITNPPYNNYIDLNILESLHNISDEFVVIHPCPYLMKNTFDSNDTLKEFIDRTANTVKSVEFFDGWDTFTIENPSPCVIIHYDKNLTTDCSVSFTQDNFFGYKSVPYKVKSLLDITYFGESYESIVKPFEQIILNHISTNGSILSTKIVNPKNLNPNAFHCQLPSIIGHTNTAKKFTKFFMNDFFAFLPKNGTFLPEVLADGTFKPTRKNNWEFATSQERDNFVSFLKTDFARFCLALRKFNKNLSDGFFTMVPLMDWNQTWTDDSLFDYFNLDQNTRQFILDFIPDFY